MVNEEKAQPLPRATARDHPTPFDPGVEDRRKASPYYIRAWEAELPYRV